MRAMLLAAGFGRRMMPLTLTVPKAAIPVLGRPLAVQVLQRLRVAGVSRAVVNLHHLPQVMRQLFDEGKTCGLPKIEFSHEKTLLGTAGGLGRVADRLRGEGPILICNSDSLADVDIEALLAAHVESRRLATLVLVPLRTGYSAVDVDSEGTVLSLAGKPTADLGAIAGSHLFAGIHVIEEELLDLVPRDRPSDIVRDVYRGLVASGRIGSYMHDGFWWEFGSPERYLEGSFHLLDLWVRGTGPGDGHDPVQKLGRAVAAIGPGATHHDQSELVGHVALGMASYVSEGSRIEDTVVMPEAWVGPRCRLRRVVVGPGTEVPAGFEAEEAVICADPGGNDELPPGLERAGGLLVYSFDSCPT